MVGPAAVVANTATAVADEMGRQGSAGALDVVPPHLQGCVALWAMSEPHAMTPLLA